MQQPTTARIPSGGLLGASIALALVILFLWSVVLSTLRHLTGSDAAGNGLAQFYAAAELVLLWIFLAILMIVAGANGATSPPIAAIWRTRVAVIGRTGDEAGRNTVCISGAIAPFMPAICIS